MSLKEVFVIKSNVTDDAKTICNDAKFIGVTEMSIDVHLLDCLIGSRMSSAWSHKLLSMLLPLGSDSIAKQDEIYNVQKQVIREMAEKESCIIVGRCADYIFRDHRNVLNIYIYAPVDARYKNCVEVLKMKPEEATKMIYKVDKARTAYHKRYAKYAPGDPDSKQIMIDSSMLGVRGTAEMSGRDCAEEIRAVEWRETTG